MWLRGLGHHREKSLTSDLSVSAKLVGEHSRQVVLGGGGGGSYHSHFPKEEREGGQSDEMTWPVT